jgi:tetratricopeptide (TPR) repeat protein
MLQALRAEGKEPAVAIEHYRYVVEQAKEERDRAFVISAYLRLSDLLERIGQPDAALEILERCLHGDGGKKKGPEVPTETQRVMLEKRKAHLTPLLAK